MEKELYLAEEFRNNYSLWITIFEGFEEENNVLICNDTMTVNTSVYLNKKIIDKQVNGNFSIDNLINTDINYYDLPDAYDGKRLWHRVRKISQEEANILLKALQDEEEETDKESWLNHMKGIKRCNNVYDFMNKYCHCLNIMSNTIDVSKVTFMSHSFLDAIKAFHENMHQVAIKTNKKQCIFLENGQIDEEKGMHIKREFIYPDGRKEKKEGWEYEPETECDDLEMV